MNKHVSVERLRHSISVARGHPTKTNTINSKFTNGNYNVSGGGSGKKNLVRRQSGHSSSSGGSGSGSSGWTGTGKAPSYKFAVSPAGSSSGGFSAREDGADERQRGMRLAQQAF